MPKFDEYNDPIDEPSFPSTDSGGYAPAAIAGIVLGVCAAVLMIAVGVWATYYRSRRDQTAEARLDVERQLAREHLRREIELAQAGLLESGGNLKGDLKGKGKGTGSMSMSVTTGASGCDGEEAVGKMRMMDSEEDDGTDGSKAVKSGTKGRRCKGNRKAKEMKEVDDRESGSDGKEGGEGKEGEARKWEG